MLCRNRVTFQCLANKKVWQSLLFKNSYVTCSDSEKILRSNLKDVEIPDMSIPEYLYSKIGKYSKLIATECAVTGRKYSYEDVRKKSRNFGRSIRNFFKLEKNDVIAIIMPNAPEYSIATLGSLDAGLIVSPVNPAYTVHEIARQLSDSGAKAIITLCSLHGTAKMAAHLAKKNLPIIAVRANITDQLPEKAVDFMELANLRVDLPNVTISPDDVAFMPYSSGTTGFPKGVLLTHRNLVANFKQTGVPELRLKIEATDTFQEVIAGVLPMFHIYGLNSTVIGSLATGSKIIAVPKFSPELYLSTIKNHKITMFLVVPPLLLFLTVHPEVKNEYFDSMRIMLSGAAPLGAADENRFAEKLGRDIPLIQGYGLTETSPTVTVSSIDNRVPGSIGSALPNTQIKIVSTEDPTKIVDSNTPGELLIKGPQVMKEYHNRPEESEKAFAEGWLRSGDVAYYTSEGNIFITDRVKELIKVKGFQVPPAELEEVIRDFPGIAEAAVIGVPHELYGEVPRAYIVPKKSTSIDIAKLSEHVNNKVAPFKRLEGGIEVVDSIPKNITGKIMRRQIKEKYLKQACN